MGEGREGDWECSGCRNRNYAFRSFCNRCKQPRLLVDAKTPADSKWLPRIGDWICSGGTEKHRGVKKKREGPSCTNNNYASREKCKKCGQAKEVAAMPAIAMPGASLPTYPHYFARGQGGPEQKMNVGLLGNGAYQQSLPLSSNWSVGGTDRYGFQPSGHPYANNANQFPMVPKGWRNGDWICNCGFHNYSSRAECKKCNATLPPALGTKRLASEELTHDWDNKRLNAGPVHDHFLPNGQQQPYPIFEQIPGPDHQRTGLYGPYPPIGSSAPPPYSVGSSSAAPPYPLPPPNMQGVPMQLPPTLLGKGAKQWRDGDWMCTSCNNHNFASRSNCNRCKTEREAVAEPVSVV